jgi:signal transduction histidine kinase/Tfp pilus assembly protein PilF
MKFKSYNIVLLAIFVFSIIPNIYGQKSDIIRTSELDSLENILLNVTGKEKVDLLNQLASENYYLSSEKLKEYAKQALELSKKINYKNGKVQSFHNLGKLYYSGGDYDNALNYYQKALKINQNIFDDNQGELKDSIYIVYKRKISSLSNNIGLVYYSLGNYDLAIEYFLKSLEMFEETLPDGSKIGKEKNIAYLNLNIGNIYLYLQNYDKALVHYKNGLKICEDIQDQNGVAGALINIGNIYTYSDSINTGLRYLQKALEIYEDIGNKKLTGTTLMNIGANYFYLDKYEESLKYYMKALGIFEEFGNKWEISKTLNNIAKVNIKQNKLNEASANLEQALKTAEETKSPKLIMDIYKNYSDFYSIKNNYQKAFEYHILYSNINDSIFSEESNKKIAEMQIKYETEKKEKEIELLQKDNEIYKLKTEKQKLLKWILFSIITITVILLLFIYNSNRIKKKANRLLEKLVKERTADLVKTNEQLKNEMAERKQLETQLIISERLAGIGEMAAGIAHEIRNPLGNITFSTQLCLRKYKPNEQMKHYLDIILRNSQNANNIITELLSFAKPREVSLKHASINDVINNTIKLTEARLTKNKVQIINQIYPDKIPNILLDEKWLGQAFLNCILNSIEAMPNGGNLTISANHKHGTGQIEVVFVDTGTGIPDDIIHKIFNPFFTTKEEGVGLGLSLVYQIIKDHNGKIKIEATETKGTRVIFNFPIPEKNEKINCNS